MRLSCVFVVVLTGVSGCFLNDDPDPESAVFALTIVNLDGAPLGDAEVSIDGAVVGTTDASGLLETEVEVARERRVRVTKASHVPVTRFLRASEGARVETQIRMASEAPPIAIAAIEDGFLADGMRGVSLQAPADAFVDATGSLVTGPVEVYLTYFDPGVRTELEAYPGELRGRDAAGQDVVLETWGVVEANVRRGDERLQVAPGATVTLRLPQPTNAAEPPATVATWTLNETTGVWEQDELDATWDATEERFIMPRSHLSPGNVDRAFIPSCIRGYVRDEAGRGVGAARVDAFTVIADRQMFVAGTHTDYDGSFCMYVERSSTVLIEVRTRLVDTPSCPEDMREDGWCVTTRRTTAGSNGVRAQWPAECSNDCRVVWPSIRTGAPDPGPRTEVECEPPEFGERIGCSAALADFYECFAPSGECMYELDPFGPFGPEYEMTFENGSRTSLEPSALYGLITRYYGPTGEHCGDVIGMGTSSTFDLPSGSVDLEVDETGRVSMDCGSGSQALDVADVDYLEGCAASPNGDGGGVSCTARPGSFNADCDAGVCDEGLDCCLTATRFVCAQESMCDAMCSSDADCPNEPYPFYCCNVGFYDACVPEAACLR